MRSVCPSTRLIITHCLTVLTRSDHKVRELTTVFLPGQHWTETSVWFDDVDISAFHVYIVVDLWQSFSEWRLLLYECVLVCRRQQLMDIAS
jgi:hypothetical protein